MIKNSTQQFYRILLICIGLLVVITSVYQLSANNMNNNEIVITELQYKTTSQGSVNPSDPAYSTEWVYRPVLDESELLLETIKVNNEISLKDYFIARLTNDTQLLSRLTEGSEQVALSDNVVFQDPPPGRSKISWRIVAESTNGTVVAVDNSSDVTIHEFPKELVIQKGTSRSSDKYGNTKEEPPRY